MKINLHKNATTTPAQRAVIQNSPHLTAAQLAEKIGVSRTTVRRWRNRSSVYDRSHAPKRLNKALTPGEEIKVVISRLITRAGLDDLGNVVRTFLGIECSRAGLNRCLKRYGVSRLPNLSRQVPFDLKDYTGTYLTYTCFHLPGTVLSASPLYLHTLTDSTFRTLNARLCISGHEFLSRQIPEFPLKVLGILYQDPVILAPVSDPAAILRHTATVESQCRSHKMIAHHLPSHPPRTLDILRETCLAQAGSEGAPDWNFPWSSAGALAQAVIRYNTRFPLGALKHQTPQQALENHYSHFPNSFRQKPETWAA